MIGLHEPAVLALAAGALLIAPQGADRPVKWDYEIKPVRVTENRPSPSPLLGMAINGIRTAAKKRKTRKKAA